MGLKQSLPPRLFLRFFEWYCDPKLRDHIEGDLIEVYRERLLQSGKREADRKFIIDVLLLFRPGIIRPFDRNRNVTTYGMYKSYFKIGWRNLLKDKGYSFINIGGLAIGLAVAMLIGLWIYDELQFNKYHANYNTIARVLRNGTVHEETFTSPSVPYALADELRTKYGSSFKNIVAAWNVGDHIVSSGNESMPLRGEFIEPDGPEMFTLKMLQGTWSGLMDQHSVLISRSAAKVLFGDDHPMGKSLKIDNKMDVKVTGVYEDLPHHSHFHDVKFFAPFDLMVSTNAWVRFQGFKSNFLHIYVQIADHTSFAAASDQIKDAILNNIRDDITYVTINPQIFLHPMAKWRLYPEWKNGINEGGLVEIVWLFAIVGVFVLMLACINFMNLSTARSEKRAKEVGIRKAIGSVRLQLMTQFFSESFLVVTLGFLMAIFLVFSSLPWFNELSGKQMQMPWQNPYFWLAGFVFILFTGLLAGSYPALYLSSFDAVRVLKGTLRAGRSASVPRSVLVVVQFTVSVALIIGTLIVYQQVEFAKDRSAGYSRAGLLMVQMTTPDFYGKYDVLRTHLKNTGAVAEMAESSSPPTDVWNSNGGFDWRGKDPDLIAEFATMTVTPNYGKTVGWQFIKGRDFSEDISSDSAAFIINEAAARVFGFDNPVGETIKWNSGYRTKVTSFTVIGVIQDMIMKSPYAPVQPAVYFLGTDKNWINIRVNSEVTVRSALPEIEAVFKKIIPAVPFDYKFADHEYDLKFAAEVRIGKLASVFAVLAVMISCLGLFGLASFVAAQRTKEIGIRKVMGATVTDLWQMLSKDFVLLVVISCVIAIPVSYYFMSGWLQRHEYRTAMPAWVFIVTSIAALVITLLTVSYQAVRAALMNPVKSLRSE